MPPHQEPRPKPFGFIDQKLQISQCPITDVASLRQHLGSDDPLCNWQKEQTDIETCDLKSCIPQDDRTALYAPKRNSKGEYDSLTFRELHYQLGQCPPFPSRSKVAIVIPVEQMAETAMALLSTISNGAVAVPLDPRMPTPRILEAMQQLQCNSVVATEQVLLGGNILQKERDGSYQTHPSLVGESANSEADRVVLESLKEIRIVEGGLCGCLQWTVLRKSADDGEVWVSGKDPSADQECVLETPEDTTMLLRTSGTTSTPKVVPISRSMLLYGAISIAAALKLKRNDCNINTMPFYHIGGISCNLLAVLVSGGSVLFAGPLKDPNEFLDHVITKDSNEGRYQGTPVPTWYYAGPSMHKAIVLIAEARWKSNQHCLPNSLRFIRSASAHLNHDLALRLSTIFQAQVIPTYGMSEAMPICSSAPIDVRNNPPCEVIDSVGYPAGTSVKIVDSDTDRVLPHGTDQVGEIVVKGPGVIPHYTGLDPANTHTDGWLHTGDQGTLDQKGRLFIKGRSKEMIKRGGEQVWPNEIDDTVEKVPGVSTAVAFGVPNDLWGEEVAVAVVLNDESSIENEAYLESLQKLIMDACHENLDELSLPQQIKFLSSTDDLLRGSTGKYIRSKMATHLRVRAVDTGALKVLTASSHFLAMSSNITALDTAPEENEPGRWHRLKQGLRSKSEDGSRVLPSDALNGLRFLVACFVVQVHVGLFPNLTWVKIQGYQPNMMIFFAIGAIQITCSVARSVKENWASFVGSKIGCLHALFVISQIITLPSYILFNCWDEEGNLAWTMTDWVKEICLWLFATVTGMGHGFDVNKFTWFQSTFYAFLVLFPFLDDYFRKQTLQRQGTLLLVFITIAASIWGILYLVIPSDIFWGGLYPIGWSIVTWLPMLISGMLAAYMFRRLVEYYQQQKKAEAALKAEEEIQAGTDTFKDPDDQNVPIIKKIKEHSKIWGFVCDFCSLLLLIAGIIVATSPNCLCIYNDTFEAMRPNATLPEEECPMSNGRDEYVWTCDISHSEFENFIQPDPNHIEYGRFPSMFSGAFGYMRTSAPLMLVWIFAMSFGQGYTARLFQSSTWTRLAPLGYPVYLLHMAVARYYWLATRGLEPQHWWPLAGEYPFPVEWYEFLVILILTMVIGSAVNSFIVPSLMPYTISLGVRICTWVSHCLQHIQMRICCCRLQGKSQKDRSTISNITADITASYPSITEQVNTMVRALTGVEVTPALQLRHLGLDSLGAAALLGMLRCSVPAAQSLTLQQLQECDTVGDLTGMLEEDASKESTSDEEGQLSSSSDGSLN